MFLKDDFELAVVGTVLEVFVEFVGDAAVGGVAAAVGGTSKLLPPNAPTPVGRPEVRMDQTTGALLR